MKLPGVVLALLVGVILLLLFIIWSITRHRAPTLRIEAQGSLPELIRSLSGLSLGTPIAGNHVQIFENGAFFDVLLEEVATAQHSVHFETFLWKDGELSRRVTEVLCGRAHAGVTVRVLLDAAGASKMGKQTEQRLRGAGCKVTRFHPRTFPNIGVFNDRDHRKIVVIDGRKAFVGGHCIVDRWLGHGQDAQSLRRRQRAFARTDRACAAVGVQRKLGGARPASFSWATRCFRRSSQHGDVSVHAVFAKPQNSAPAVKILHHAIMRWRAERIWIQNPYFIPEPDAIEAFGARWKRGVDVRVLMPSTSVSDNADGAARRRIATSRSCCACGVRLFEYPHTLLHQKVMTVDGVWSAVGSSNFDDRSFETNDEVTVGMLDPKLARELELIFERDLEDCVEVRLEKWSRRSVFHKLKDHFFYFFNERA